MRKANRYRTITFFHRNLKAGYSINKVTQTIVSTIGNKEEFFVPSYRVCGILRNLWFVVMHRNKEGINHITGDIHYCILALLGCRSVLTIHDTVSIDYICSSKLKSFFIKEFWFVLPIKHATKVVCISEETKKQVLRFSNRKDIEVIHNAIDPSFSTIPKDQTKKPYKILVVGTSKNKNLERTILALEGIDCELRIIGKLNAHLLDLLEKAHISYTNQYNLSDEEIMNEYINCDIVSFISLFEGFGMPIIEANKIGRPVITSNIPVLREIAGDSSLFVNPLDITDIHQGFVRLMEDANLREMCVYKGLENVKRFSYASIREQWVRLYDSII